MIKGFSAPTPRPTGWALIYVLVFVAAPLIGMLALLDLALYLFFEHVLGMCYAIFCLF